jgi:hypothetical protein
MTTDPGPDGPRDRDADPEKVRAKRVLYATSALAVLVMGLVVFLGMRSRDDEGSGPPSAFSNSPYSTFPSDPNRDVEEVPGGCRYDADHPPRLVFDLPPDGVSFGAVKQGVKIERDVTFRNEGSGALCIRRVDSGCGCIKARLVGEKRRYEPGEAGTIRVILDTKGREGQQKKTITLFTNAENDPLRKFVVRAAITLGMRVGPSFLNFGRATVGQPAKATIRLRTPKDDADWEVTSVEGTRLVGEKPLPYEWTVNEIPDPRDLIREVVVVHPGLSSKDDRSFKDEIVVRTTHADHPEYRVPAHLLVVPPILAVPPRAVLGYVPSRLPPPRVRLVPGDTSVEFRITKLEFELPRGAENREGGPGFVAKMGQDDAGEWWVEVHYDGKPRKAGPLKATLVVHTDLDRMPELRIECFATVEGKR